jgi:GT2 family glycosyltransferase/glycosyltransferase involved in cell wall biosynthesis
VNDATVIGHVDGLEGAYVCGWALGPNGTPCRISITDENDRTLVSGLACLERGDLLGVGQDRCDIAFRIALPSLGGARGLRVWADGVEISHQPIPLGAGYFDGHVAIGAGRAEGWVSERCPGAAPPLVTAVDQYGIQVMRCQARRDESAHDDTISPAKFVGVLEDICFGRGELRLNFFANGVKFAESRCAFPLSGFLETATAERCAGWLLSQDAPDRTFTIEIFRNGKPVGKTRTEIARIDVQASFPACRRSGFDISLPPAETDHCGLATLSLRFPGSSVELLDGPYVAGDRAALVKSARQVSRLALGAEPAALGAAEWAVMQAALADFLARARGREMLAFGRQRVCEDSATRLNIIVPIYKNPEITRACIDSVLDWRGPADRIVLIDDCSPEPGMADMLRAYTGYPDVFLIRNEENLGFVRTVNRGLAFCCEGDVLLLNSDTRLFAGSLDELWQVAHASPDIGTVTALSNNATIFSYPTFGQPSAALDDIGWEELARVALQRNQSRAVDVPTGHGFCLLIKREVLRRVGMLDEIFGRGYGEENDFCARAADLGYRNVAAAGVFVEHREGVSFGSDRAALLARNMRLLETRYPEYMQTVLEAERSDTLRVARWAMDSARLERATASGQNFVLVVCHRLGGGTSRAMDDIEATVGYGGATKLTLCCRNDGVLELSCDAPVLKARFAPDETAALLSMLSAAEIGLAVVHQVLGFSAASIEALGDWLRGRRAIFYAHDFYPLCPRVTMIDAVNRFCNLAAPDVCLRCVVLGGAHEGSRLQDVAPDRHRAVFGEFLSAFSNIIAPSESAAGYYRSVFPALEVEVISHPAEKRRFPAQPRAGSDDEIVLLGAIGPHKGSADLLAIAHLARLTHPHLSFRVIGYTNIDDDLTSIGNVTITGAYQPQDVPGLLAQARGRLALFLSNWPETFSYTLTEAVQHGFIPLVPNIGAPADRVAAAGVGAVFDFPISPAAVLALITAIAGGKRKPAKRGGALSAYAPDPHSIARTRELFGVQDD